MKTLALIVGAVALAFFLVNLAALPGKIENQYIAHQATNDPIQAMRKLAGVFPTHYRASDNTDIAISDIGFDVKKTDSIVNPLRGVIHSYECGTDFEYVFHWEQNRWVFSQLICMANGMDHTDTSGGRERWNSPEFKAFLETCR